MITQLENTFKVKIESLSARVIDLETNNDSLLGKFQKGTNKGLTYLEEASDMAQKVAAAHKMKLRQKIILSRQNPDSDVKAKN